MPPQPLIILLLAPALLLTLTTAFHLLSPLPSLSAFKTTVRRRLRRNLPRAAFGLPPLPRPVSVRAAAFLSLCASAFLSIGCGAAYLLLSTNTFGDKYLHSTPPVTQAADPNLIAGSNFATVLHPSLSAGTAALLTGSVLALPSGGVLLGAAGVFLRLTAHSSSPTSASTPSSKPTPAQSLRRLLGGNSAKHLTHAAVLRSSFAGLLLAAAGVGACAAVPKHAGLILLIFGGCLSVAAVAVGVLAWRSKGRDLGEKFEAAAKYAAAVSFARKSRDALGLREEVDLSHPNTSSNSYSHSHWHSHGNSSSNPNPNSSGQTHSSNLLTNDSDLLLGFDFEHILPPRHEIDSTSVAVRSEVSRARAELAAAASSRGPGTPRRGRWEPPVGSPSSWVTERDRYSSTLPEWDFRASLPGQHRRTSSSFTTGTMAALGLGPSLTDIEESKTSTAGKGGSSNADTFHTAPSALNSGRHQPNSSISSSVHTTYNQRRSIEPSSERSTRPDGSVVGTLEPSPFDPLPPHNFSSLTKLSLPRSVSTSANGSAGVEMPAHVATLADGRMLALVDHGEHVAVHDYSLSHMSHSGVGTNTSSSFVSTEQSHTNRTGSTRGRRPADISLPMRSTRTVNTLPTIPDTGTPTSPWDATSPWPSGDLIDPDGEWVPVDAPASAESWRRADSVCGLLAVVGLVICVALTTPLLALGPHPATLITYAVSLSLPAPALALATFCTKHTPSVQPVPSPAPAPASVTSAQPRPAASLRRESLYVSIDFGRIDYSQPRWSALGHSGSNGLSAVLGGSLRRSQSTARGRTISAPAPLMPLPNALQGFAPTTARGPASEWFGSGHACMASGARRTLELLKPKPQICVARDKISRLRGGVTSFHEASIPKNKHRRAQDSFSSEEANFVSLDMSPPRDHEAAEIRTVKAVRLTSRCPSFVDLSTPPGGITFSDSMQALVVERLTRRRTLDAEQSYRVDSYCEEHDENDSGKRGVIVRTKQAAIDFGDGSLTVIDGEGEPRVSNSSFNPARASTPLGRNYVKGSATTGVTATGDELELDLSVDWDGLGLPPPPQLPEAYCGLAYAPRFVSHAPSARLDDGEMARASHEAETSMVANAGWIQTLMDGWTPRTARTKSVKSAKSAKSAKAWSVRSGMSKADYGFSQQTAMDSQETFATATGATSGHSDKSWRRNDSDPQTPSTVARMERRNPTARLAMATNPHPLAPLPPLPTLAPPPPLPAALTQPALSPVLKHAPDNAPPWSPRIQSMTQPRRVARTPEEELYAYYLTLLQQKLCGQQYDQHDVERHALQLAQHHYADQGQKERQANDQEQEQEQAPKLRRRQEPLPAPTPQRAHLHHSSRQSGTYTVSRQSREEMHKTVGAVATVGPASTVDSSSRSPSPLRSLKLVERAIHRNSLRDSVVSKPHSSSSHPYRRSARSEYRSSVHFQARSAHSELRSPDFQTSDFQTSVHTACSRSGTRTPGASDWTEGTSRFADADESYFDPEPEKPATATFGRHHLRPDLAITYDMDKPPRAKSAASLRPEPPNHEVKMAQSYSSLRAATSPTEEASAIASLREFSLSTSTSTSAPHTSRDEVEARPIGVAIKRPARTGANTTVVFADSTESSRAKISTGPVNRTFGPSFSTLMMSGKVSTGPESISKLSTGSSALADCTNTNTTTLSLSNPPNLTSHSSASVNVSAGWWPLTSVSGHSSGHNTTYASNATSGFGRISTGPNTTTWTGKASTGSNVSASKVSIPPKIFRRSNPPPATENKDKRESAHDKENDPLNTAHWTSGVRTGRGRRNRGSTGPGLTGPTRAVLSPAEAR